MADSEEQEAFCVINMEGGSQYSERKQSNDQAAEDACEGYIENLVPEDIVETYELGDDGKTTKKAISDDGKTCSQDGIGQSHDKIPKNNPEYDKSEGHRLVGCTREALDMEDCCTDQLKLPQLLMQLSVDDPMIIELCRQIISIAFLLNTIPNQPQPKRILVQRSQDHKRISLKLLVHQENVDKAEMMNRLFAKEEAALAVAHEESDENIYANEGITGGTAKGGIHQRLTVAGNSEIRKQVIYKSHAIFYLVTIWLFQRIRRQKAQILFTICHPDISLFCTNSYDFRSV